jgi:hypothetical protein
MSRKEKRVMNLSEGNGLYMPVAPAYGAGGNGGFGFGGDWGSLIVLFLIAAMFGGFGGGWGGMGGFGGGNYDFPWLLNGQQNINSQTANGFRDAMINDGITSIRDGISGLSTQLCGCCGDMQMAIANGFAGVEAGANARQIANMQTAFGIQSQIAQASADNRLGIAGIGSDIAREACATRTTDTQNTQAILNAVTSGVQSIKDQLCQDKIDQKNDEISALRQQVAMKDLAASQTAQNAFIANGFANEVDALYNRLSSCPVPSTPVYGRTPIFTCSQNGCGCGCGNF